MVSDLLARSFPRGRGTQYENALIDIQDGMDLEEEQDHGADIEVIDDLLYRSDAAAGMRRSGKHVKSLKKCRINGIVYSCSSSHAGNSLIQFRRSKKTRAQDAGEIEYIVQDSDRLRIVVRPHLALSQAVVDPFSEYKDFPGRLYSQNLGDRILIESDQIVSHVARFTIPKTTEVVIVSLSRF